MSAKRGVVVLWGTFCWHPAVVAWREIAPDAPEPERIESYLRGVIGDRGRNPAEPVSYRGP